MTKKSHVLTGDMCALKGDRFYQSQAPDVSRNLQTKVPRRSCEIFRFRKTLLIFYVLPFCGWGSNKVATINEV